jgi:hypothetical protein
MVLLLLPRLRAVFAGRLYIHPLEEAGKNIFHGRIVDDTLVLIKPSDIYQQYYSNSIIFIHFRTLFTAGELNVAISRVLTTKHSFGSRVWLE